MSWQRSKVKRRDLSQYFIIPIIEGSLHNINRYYRGIHLRQKAKKKGKIVLIGGQVTVNTHQTSTNFNDYLEVFALIMCSATNTRIRLLHTASSNPGAITKIAPGYLMGCAYWNHSWKRMYTYTDGIYGIEPVADIDTRGRKP